MKRLIASLLTCLALALAFAQPARSDAALGMNLAGVSDWSSQQPFLDVMKSARRWIGHRANQWGGADYDDLSALGVLDENGWPTRIPGDLRAIGTLLLTDLPQDATLLAGRYLVRFEGDGIIEARGRAQNVRYGPNRVTFDFTPGPGGVDLRINRTDRFGTGDYIRNITVVREDRAALHDSGEVFNPDWLVLLEGFSALRFMDWMYTNDSTQGAWAERPRVDDFSYTREGVPLEVMISLANRLSVAPWFNMPHGADDAYVRAFAEATSASLRSDLRAYVEFSNEVWNWQFLQADWAEAEAKKRWGEAHRWVQFHGMRAAEVAQIWSDVFEGERHRLVNVIATQTGWQGLEAQILNAPLFVAEAAGNTAPVEAFDAYAITGYFGHGLGTDRNLPVVERWLAESRAAAQAEAAEAGLTGDEAEQYALAHRYETAIARAAEALRDPGRGGIPEDNLSAFFAETLPYHRAIAEAHGLDLIAYEAGTHVVGIGAAVSNEALADFFVALNYSDEMGALYAELIEGWEQGGGGLMAIFTDVSRPGKWGSWGTLRHTGDDNARWQALRSWLDDRAR